MGTPHAAELAQQVASASLFEGVPSERLAGIVGLAQSKPLGRGRYFFREGDAAKWFFVLTSGRVKLTQLTSEGHRVVFRMIGPGEAFGGVGAFGDPTYPVSAETAEASTALAWTSSTMRSLVETDPTITLNALRMVAARMHDLHRRYRQAMTEHVERRVARAVLRLAHEAGQRVEAGVEIGFPVSRQDLAEMTGTTLYTVSRLMSAWQSQGLVRGGRQRIVLAQPERLVAIADDLSSR